MTIGLERLLLHMAWANQETIDYPGQGYRAMGDPVPSPTCKVNWVRKRGRPVFAGEWVSTGICTGHSFVQVGDLVSVDFGDLGLVEAKFL